MFLLPKCFPWSPSYLSEKGDHLLFRYTCRPCFILVLLCLFCCVTVFLCHPPYSTLVPFIFFTLFFNWREMALRCCVGFLLLPTLACQGWSQGGGDWTGTAAAVFALFSQGRCCSEGFTFTLKSSFESHSDPVKVRPFL